MGRLTQGFRNNATMIRFLFLTFCAFVIFMSLFLHIREGWGSEHPWNHEFYGSVGNSLWMVFVKVFGLEYNLYHQ